MPLKTKPKSASSEMQRNVNHQVQRRRIQRGGQRAVTATCRTVTAHALSLIDLAPGTDRRTVRRDGVHRRRRDPLLRADDQQPRAQQDGRKARSRPDTTQPRGPALTRQCGRRQHKAHPRQRQPPQSGGGRNGIHLRHASTAVGEPISRRTGTRASNAPGCRTMASTCHTPASVKASVSTANTPASLSHGTLHSRPQVGVEIAQLQFDLRVRRLVLESVRPLPPAGSHQDAPAPPAHARSSSPDVAAPSTASGTSPLTWRAGSRSVRKPTTPSTAAASTISATTSDRSAFRARAPTVPASGQTWPRPSQVHPTQRQQRRHQRQLHQ